MADRYITCKVHDNLKRIVKVGIDGHLYDKDEVWHWIKNHLHMVYVTVGGKTVLVYAHTSSDGFRYLTTSPDGYPPNNLDNLPNC